MKFFHDLVQKSQDMSKKARAIRTRKHAAHQNSKVVKAIKWLWTPFHKLNEIILKLWAPIQIHFSVNNNHVRDKFLLYTFDTIIVVVGGLCIFNLYQHGVRAQINMRHTQREKVINAINEDPDILARMPKVHRKYNFVHEFAQMDEDQPKKDQVLPSIVIAQAALESTCGKSQLYTRGDNPFGIKGEYNGQGIDFYTNEYSNGETTNQKAEFKKYPNLETSVKDHNKLLIQKYLKGADPTSYISVANALQKNHYATDPKYALKLDEYIKENNLDRFD